MVLSELGGELGVHRRQVQLIGDGRPDFIQSLYGWHSSNRISEVRGFLFSCYFFVDVVFFYYDRPAWRLCRFLRLDTVEH